MHADHVCSVTELTAILGAVSIVWIIVPQPLAKEVLSMILGLAEKCNKITLPGSVIDEMLPPLPDSHQHLEGEDDFERFRLDQCRDRRRVLLALEQYQSSESTPVCNNILTGVRNVLPLFIDVFWHRKAAIVTERGCRI